MKVSDHFWRNEFTCNCCGLYIPNPELLLVLERIRMKIHRPLFINSGTRCEKHNFESGGSIDSWHLTGQAADVPTTGKRDKLQFVKYAIEAGATDIGVYDWGIHIAVDTPVGLWRGK